MHWSIWLIAGLLLVATEMFILLDFWCLFLGTGALLTGVIVFLFPNLPLSVQFLCAAVLALLSLVTFKPRVQRWLHSGADNYREDVTGDEVTISEEIPAGARGRGELRGAVWTVRNDSGVALKTGARHRVNERDGLELIVTE